MDKKETHEERADRIISMLVWLDGLPPHRRATLKDMIVAGMMEAVAYEQERNANNVAAADVQIRDFKSALKQCVGAMGLLQPMIPRSAAMRDPQFAKYIDAKDRAGLLLARTEGL